jgi:hypothetical protein
MPVTVSLVGEYLNEPSKTLSQLTVACFTETMLKNMNVLYIENTQENGRLSSGLLMNTTSNRRRVWGIAVPCPECREITYGMIRGGRKNQTPIWACSCGWRSGYLAKPDWVEVPSSDRHLYDTNSLHGYRVILPYVNGHERTREFLSCLHQSKSQSNTQRGDGQEEPPLKKIKLVDSQ